jgi:predicted glycosyltransferase/peptidoglycan/xylan/chitin deacetylase (PgdA/CDA1 family)
MKLVNYYYRVKPLIPRRMQIALRRALAARKRKKKKEMWPVHLIAAKKPVGWKGWPSQKEFALVFNHDVDTIKGLCNCAKLMEIEKRLGFRSSFNFVPEDYPTPPALRKKLAESGFEVGVHGLRHDGRTFLSQATFFDRAARINHYLKEWGAVGFTSPSMLRNLSLMAELDIEHGCSTFDTDPFEPQSEGMKTIFPFFATNGGGTRSYVELPYTLPQDHGLFVILKEKDNRIWKEKLDWIVENGGMALLNSHPDYMNFDTGRLSFEEYPINFYIDFLEYIKRKYSGQYWHVLPREMAQFWKRTDLNGGNRLNRKGRETSVSPDIRATPPLQDPRAGRTKIWIDLDNTPHVPFFIPIIEALERRGHQVVLTARDAFQVCELADQKGLRYTKIGHHYGKNPIMKIAGLFWRSSQLLPYIVRQKPALALSHGARSQILLCNFLRIPTVLIADYEYSRSIPMAWPKWLIVPESLFGYDFSIKPNRLRFYRGIKEDVYVPGFRPDPALVEELGLSRDKTIITVRPPASEAHYHNPESDRLLEEFMSRICQSPDTQVVLLPRNCHQEQALRAAHPNWFIDAKTIVPPGVLDGLNLIWFSDVVVSGGGTMNREAAALGIPVYSIFRGTTGVVDSVLEQEGRLIMIRSADEIWGKIQFVRRNKNLPLNSQPRIALKDIIDNIEDIIRIERIGSKNGNNTAKAAG